MTMHCKAITCVLCCSGLLLVCGCGRHSSQDTESLFAGDLAILFDPNARAKGVTVLDPRADTSLGQHGNDEGSPRNPRIRVLHAESLTIVANHPARGFFLDLEQVLVDSVPLCRPMEQPHAPSVSVQTPLQERLCRIFLSGDDRVRVNGKVMAPDALWRYQQAVRTLDDTD